MAAIIQPREVATLIANVAYLQRQVQALRDRLGSDAAPEARLVAGALLRAEWPLEEAQERLDYAMRAIRQSEQS